MSSIRANNTWEINGGDDVLQIIGQGGNVLGGIGNNGAGYGALSGGQSDLFGLSSVTGFKVISINQNVSTSGQFDFYTTPAGRRALLVDVTGFCITGNSASAVVVDIKLSGTYFPISNSASIFSNGLTSFNVYRATNNLLPYIAEAGEIFSITATTASSYNLTAVIFEFDNTSSVGSSKIINPASGLNTIFICPPGKTAISISPFLSLVAPISSANISNVSGGSVTYTPYYVPSGASAGNTTQGGPATAVTSGSILSFPTNGYIAYASGDSLVINATSGTVGQLIWTNFILF